MKKYYAKFTEVNDIAIFKDEKSRDEWVSFNDWLSKETQTNSLNCTFKREALTAEQAEAIAGKSLYDIHKYRSDDVLDGVCWVSA